MHNAYGLLKDNFAIAICWFMKAVEHVLHMIYNKQLSNQ
jgi:hypothetical protein